MSDSDADLLRWRIVSLVGTLLLLLLVAGLQLFRTQGAFGANLLGYDVVGLCCVIVVAGCIGFQVGLWAGHRMWLDAWRLVFGERFGGRR